MTRPEVSTGHIDQRVYSRIAETISTVARSGSGEKAPFTVDAMTWQYDAGVEHLHYAKPIGVSTLQGSTEDVEWSRFTRFDQRSRRTLMHGMHAQFVGIRGQVEFRKETASAELNGMIRTFQQDEEGKVHLSVTGYKPAVASNEELAVSMEFARFASRFGLGSAWNLNDRTAHPIGIEGWMSSRTGWAVAAALGEIAAERG